MTGEDLLTPVQSETDSLRQQLLQAQRLSSVGALASSVAHEFNNILTTIINYAKLGMRGNLEPSQKQAFEKILKGGQRRRRHRQRHAWLRPQSIQSARADRYRQARRRSLDAY